MRPGAQQRARARAPPYPRLIPYDVKPAFPEVKVDRRGWPCGVGLRCGAGAGGPLRSQVEGIVGGAEALDAIDSGAAQECTWTS